MNKLRQKSVKFICNAMPFAKKLKIGFILLSCLGLFSAAGLYFLMAASLPSENGNLRLPDLSAGVTVNIDALGVPSIQAVSRNDVFRVIGFLHARDRLFQMELMRRKSAGRLAEIFGEKAVAIDKAQRDYQLEQTAQQVVSALPAEQKSVLTAYTAGINAFLAQAKVLPPEFIALNFQPEAWRPADSILVALGMFQTLNGQEQDERMLSIMEAALPSVLVRFLTPDTDAYATVLLGGMDSRRPAQAVPEAAFNALEPQAIALAKGGVDVESAIAGSNNWVIAGQKSADGRTIIANDMHLQFSAPNIWYRARYGYADREFNGLTLPGLPLPIVGSNGHVAWGFTNATADFLDLISLEINPENAQEYLTPEGWRRFSTRSEQIVVKGGAAIPVQLRATLWGPVSSKLLLGKTVAVKWVALEPQAVDLGLLDMDSVASTQAAMKLMPQIGSPPQNVVFADTQGHIGWTYMGRFPKRNSFDGSVSLSWVNPAVNWDGFIPATEMPSLFDPPEGFIVTANNRTLGSNYPYALGYNWALGYRAYRIAELLREKSMLTEQDMLRIQLDTRSELFEFYRNLALSVLNHLKSPSSEQQMLVETLHAWDGNMQANSKGVALLIAFRAKLAEGVFAKVVAQCRKFDPNFNYAWRELETPLRALLTRRPKGVIALEYQDDWELFIRQTLELVAQDLARTYPKVKLTELNWGDVNRISLAHPLSKALPMLESFLNINDFGSDGCAGFCVKVVSNAHGASERLVIAPAHPEDGILEMPGGQSGQPFSRHYRDQQAAWQAGDMAAFLPGDAVGVLHFQP